MNIYSLELFHNALHIRIAAQKFDIDYVVEGFNEFAKLILYFELLS
ncbi:MAG: hypothetical protein LBP40_02215 [Campylobacteraceae bacterium]|nr:hypothetical protein [Campylobacteraceae bacterium]